MTITTTTELESRIQSLDFGTSVSPYQLARLVNVVLTEEGRKEIPTQMAYNYVGKKFIPSYKNSEGKTQVKASAAREWATKYLTKRLGLAVQEPEQATTA